jgi:hypothetical protein
MTTFEMMLSLSSVAAGAATIFYVANLVKISGRDRPEDPERLQRFIEDAPYERLDRVLQK